MATQEPDAQTQPKERPQAKQGGDLSLVGLSGHRPEKTIGPLAATPGNASLVTDDSSSLIQRLKTLYANGREAIETQRPDVIVAGHVGFGGFAATLLSLRYRVPLVVRLGGDPWRVDRDHLREHVADRDVVNGAILAVAMVFNWLTLARARGYLCVSADLKETVIQRTGCSPEQVGVVPVPLDADEFADGDGLAARATLGVPSGAPLIVTVTNLRFEGKFEAIRDALPAVESVLRETPDAHYVIAGDGRYRAALDEAIAETVSADVRDRVHTPGYVDDIADCYAAADVVLYPSYIDAHPNAVLEAQAAGRPIVTNPAPAMRELVTHGETGLLVDLDEEEPEELATALQYLLDDPTARTRLGTVGADLVRERSSPERVGERVRDALATIMEH